MSSSTLMASDHINVRHQLTDLQIDGDFQSISLTLLIENAGDQDLHRVKLAPSGNVFSINNLDKQLNIGFLPAMGQAVFNWTADTSHAIHYFRSGMPIFFHVKAKLNNGKEIVIPVYSRGDLEL